MSAVSGEEAFCPGQPGPWTRQLAWFGGTRGAGREPLSRTQNRVSFVSALPSSASPVVVMALSTA